MPLYHYRASDPGGNIVRGTWRPGRNAWWCCTSSKAASFPCASARKRRPPAGKGGLARASQSPGAPPGRGALHPGAGGALKGRPAPGPQPPGPPGSDQPARHEGRSWPRCSGTCKGAKACRTPWAGTGSFSSLYVSLVEAGETGGFLDEALDRLGDYLKTVSEFRSYLITALIYPMILAGVGVPLPHPHAPLRGAPLRGFFQGDGPEPLLEHQLPAGPEPGHFAPTGGRPDCWRPWRC